MALVRLLRPQDRTPATKPAAPSGASFRDLVERLRCGDREAFEELFDAFFVYVHYHVELSGRIDEVPRQVREQVTAMALWWLFEELMQWPLRGPAACSDGAADGEVGGPATDAGDGHALRRLPIETAARPPWQGEPRASLLHPSWTRRALELAAAAQRTLLDGRSQPR